MDCSNWKSHPHDLCPSPNDAYMLQMMHGGLFSTLPVLRVEAGSNNTIQHSSVSGWPVLDASRNHDKLTGFNPFVVIAEIYAKASRPETSRFLIVVMEDELVLPVRRI